MVRPLRCRQPEPLPNRQWKWTVRTLQQQKEKWPRGQKMRHLTQWLLAPLPNQQWRRIFVRLIRHHTGLYRAPPTPPPSVDSLAVLLARAPPGAAQNLNSEETIPEEVDPAATGTGTETAPQEDDDLTNDGSCSESSRMVQEGSKAESESESASEEESESDDESDVLESLEEKDDANQPETLTHQADSDSASSSATGAGED
eukprot:scaffold37175_cov48-Attheya_sp.AAC.1